MTHTTTTTADGRDRWLVPSASQPEPRIVIRAKGVLTCDCLGFIYRRTCSHVTAVAEHLSAEEAQATAARAELVAEGVGLLLGVAKRTRQAAA